RVHLEELDGTKPPPDTIPFRFGYALTCHTAQGGEWSTVFIDKPDLFAMARAGTTPKRRQEFQQWAYTAMTRAKATLGFLLHHALDQSERLRAPAGTPLPTEGRVMTADPIPPDPDDIPEPEVPPAVAAAVMSASTEDAPTPAWAEHEALLQGFCQQFQKRFEREWLTSGTKLMQALDVMSQSMQRWIEGHLQANEHSQYQLSDALLKLQERGVQLRHDPYTADVTAMSPQGFGIVIHVAKHEVSELIGALPALTGWLAQEGYKPVG